MIFLTDNMAAEGSLLLWKSLQAAFPGNVTGVSISDSGFWPDGVISPYAFFMGEELPERSGPEAVLPLGSQPSGRPLYFNEVPIPEYWQIRGTGTNAEVWDYEHLRARIFYAEPKYQRHVHVVDWLDESGAVRSCDYYDRDGRRMAQVIMDGQGHNITKTWYDRQNRIVIYENVPAGEILLEDYVTDHGRTHAFHSLWEFTDYFLLRSGLALDRIAYNSLSTSFFAARHLLTDHGIPGEDILFWQEPVGEDIPGNMKVILEEAGQGGRAQKIAVQSREAYRKIQAMGDLTEDDRKRFSPVGFIYPFVPGDSSGNEAGGAQGETAQGETAGNGRDLLILTNSDQICGLPTLVEALPEFTFHIGALTEMSQKLLSFARYPNVDLQPNIAVAAAEQLQNSCGCYLDINYGDEILHAVRTAFLHRMPVLAFSDTVHERNYAAAENVFPHTAETDVTAMVSALREMDTDPAARLERIRQQEAAAMAESADTYRTLM